MTFEDIESRRRQLTSDFKRLKKLNWLFSACLAMSGMLIFFEGRFNWAWWAQVILINVAIVVLIIDFRVMRKIDRREAARAREFQKELKEMLQRRARSIAKESEET